jgi:hypothetical protein
VRRETLRAALGEIERKEIEREEEERVDPAGSLSSGSPPRTREASLTGTGRPDRRPRGTTTPKPGTLRASGRVSRLVTRLLKRAIRRSRRVLLMRTRCAP